MSWLRHRYKRTRYKWKHLKNYFQTLTQANEIERFTDFNRCKKPILLLYGFFATRRSIAILETRLRNDGYDVLCMRLGGLWDLFNTEPVDFLAKKVSQKIESLYHRYPLPKLAIVGYSKGGLVGRYYVSQLGGHHRIHTLITLATSHRGNPWARFGFFSKGLRQMSPGSRFLKRLNQSTVPNSVYLASVYSEKDWVSPAKYSRLPEDEKSFHNIKVSHLYHTDFVIKQSAYKIILEHLRAGFARATFPKNL